MSRQMRVLSGPDVIRAFQRFGFEVIDQRGSHVKLRRIGSDGSKQTLNVPLHRELDRGTCRAIFEQALRYVSRSELEAYFYTD